MREHTDKISASGVKTIAFEQVDHGWIATACTLTGEVLGIGRGHSIPEARAALDQELIDGRASRTR